MSAITINLAQKIRYFVPTRSSEDCSVLVTPFSSCNAVLVGQAGYGKSFAVDVWLWRYVQAGGHAVLISGEEQQHGVQLANIIRKSTGDAGSVFVAMNNPGILDGSRLFTVVDTTSVNRFSHSHEERRGLRSQKVCELLHRITKDRINLTSLPMPPLLVVIDDEVDLDVSAPALAEALATWSALGIHLWVTAQSITQFTEASALAVRSFWLTTQLRVFFRHPYAEEQLVALTGLNPDVVRRLMWSGLGDIVIQQSSGSVEIGHVTPSDYECWAFAGGQRV